MKDLIGVILAIIGVIVLMIDVQLNDVEWTVMSIIGLSFAVPGLILMIKHEIYKRKNIY